MEERSWEGAAHEYEEQARFARAELDKARDRIAELEAEAENHRAIEEMVLRAKAARIAELETERDRLLVDHAINLMSWQAERDRLKAEQDSLRLLLRDNERVHNKAITLEEETK